MISTDFGVLHRLSWDGRYDSSLVIHLQRVPFANDLLPESRGVCVCVWLIANVSMNTLYSVQTTRTSE